MLDDGLAFCRGWKSIITTKSPPVRHLLASSGELLRIRHVRELLLATFLLEVG